MMLRFQWDSLRRGDRIVFHDARSADLGSRPADVGRIVRPGRFVRHVDPLAAADVVACWRCDEALAA